MMDAVFARYAKKAGWNHEQQVEMLVRFAGEEELEEFLDFEADLTDDDQVDQSPEFVAAMARAAGGL